MMMRAFFRLLAALAVSCLVLVLVTTTVVFIKKVWFGKDSSRHSHVAVLDVSGVIISSSSTVRDLEELLENSSVKALVIRVNSPGGLVAPSQELYEAFKRADQKIPVVISMESLAASGGYYAALGGRTIFANAGTLTASIGVIMEFANTEKLYQWAKVERFTLKAGRFKDVGSPLRPMQPAEKELLTAMLADIHQQFRSTVKERRHLTDAELDNTADGRIMTGSQAKTAKLVDQLGTFQDAVREAKKLAKLPESAEVVYPDSHSGLIKRLLLGSAEGSFDNALQAFGQYFSSNPVAQGWRILLLAPLR